MKIWLISQNEVEGRNTFTSAVVCARTEEEAKAIHPGSIWSKFSDGTSPSYWGDKTWASSPDKVNVEEIGLAHPKMEIGVILSDFNQS